MQTNLFGHTEPEKIYKKGQSEVSYKQASSILTQTSGFMKSYDFSLNPYSGCSFGCTYCYAAFFVRNKEKIDNWGYWVEVKENAVSLLKKWRKKPLDDKTIYLSSVTDPYQPIEKDLELTRSLLEELGTYHKPRLVVQTRSNLVTRDIDLLRQFDTVQVNMTVTTDSEKVRKVFEPYCPSNTVRIKAIQEIHAAGIPSCITLTPLLPVVDPHRLAKDMLDTGIEKFIIQPFHATRGKFVAGTRKQALELIEEMNWTQERYQEVQDIIQSYIPHIGIGKEGFKPI